MAEEEDGTVTDITAKLAEALREALSVATTHRVAALDAIHGARGQTTHVIFDGEWYAFGDRVRAALTAYTASQSTPDDETVERVARAIWDVDAPEHRMEWDEETSAGKERYHCIARAALSAIPARDDALDALRELSERATKGPWGALDARLFQIPIEPLDATTDEEPVCLADFDMDQRVNHDSEGVANADLAGRCVNYVRAKLAQEPRS